MSQILRCRKILRRRSNSLVAEDGLAGILATKTQVVLSSHFFSSCELAGLVQFAKAFPLAGGASSVLNRYRAVVLRLAERWTGGFPG
ncbi:MAG: hypothetical protein ACUVQG_10990 [Thermogutta sp.]